MPIKTSRSTILPDHLKSPALDLFVPAFENFPYQDVLGCRDELKSVANTNETLAEDPHSASVTITAKYLAIPYVPDLNTTPVHLDRGFSVEYHETAGQTLQSEPTTVMLAAVYGLMRFRRTMDDGIKKDTYSYAVRHTQPPKLDRHHNRELYSRLMSITKAAKFLAVVNARQTS